MPHHGRFEPNNPRKEEPEFENPMVSYKSPITRSMAKFINLVIHLDGKEAFGGLEGN